MKIFVKHLKKELHSHIFQYLLLFSIAILFLALFSMFKENNPMRFVVASAFIVFYTAWGVLQHYLEKTLDYKIVIEYIVLGATAIFLYGILLI